LAYFQLNTWNTPAPGSTFSLDALDLSWVIGSEIKEASETHLTITRGSLSFSVGGENLTYDRNDQLVFGTIFFLNGGDTAPGANQWEFRTGDRSLTAERANNLLFHGSTQDAIRELFAGSDTFQGSSANELLRGYAGDDLLRGGVGSDSLFGGLGNDTIAATHEGLAADGSGSNRTDPTYLRGDEGNDVIYGGKGFDDINGNMGDDTANGYDGNDWVVGGKDQDSLTGATGDDIVYGNLGSDTCVGNEGADIVRGGQQDDILQGGDGNDWLSGDRDNDTITGGAGADIFHSFGDAGIDRVTDFNRAEGDRVLLDPGSTYTVAQSGGDTVISVGGGAQVVLVGVSMSTLSGDWISVG